MIVRGLVINARRVGKTLAMVTTPANASGAATHTHKAGEPLPGVIPLIHRDNAGDMRSEEHTSELQSRLHLVCRLLLEKKNEHHTQLNAIRLLVNLLFKPACLILHPSQLIMPLLYHDCRSFGMLIVT